MSLITDLLNVSLSQGITLTLVNYALVTTPSDPVSIDLPNGDLTSAISLPADGARTQVSLQTAVRLLLPPAVSVGMTDVYIGKVAPTNTEIWIKNHSLSMSKSVPLLENKPALVLGAAGLILGRL